MVGFKHFYLKKSMYFPEYLFLPEYTNNNVGFLLRVLRYSNLMLEYLT
jgi:hypothetical protein